MLYPRCSRVALLASLLILSAAEVAAEAPQDRADVLFQAGKAAARAKNWHEAHRLLAQAWQLKQSYDIASNLGQVAYLLGRHAEAAQHVAFALRHYPPSADSEQKAKAESLLDLAKREVASVHLRVSEPEAEVLVDGTVRGRARLLPPELFVEPGARRIGARIAGESVEREVVAQKGAVYQVDLVLSPSQVSAPAHVAPVQDSSQAAQQSNVERDALAPSTDARQIVVLVGAGLTLVSASALGIYSVKRSRAASRARTYRARASESGGSSACQSPTTSDCEKLEAANADYHSAGTAQKVFLGTTLGFAAATLASYLWWPESGPVETGDQAFWHPIVTPEVQGLGWAGSF